MSKNHEAFAMMGMYGTQPQRVEITKVQTSVAERLGGKKDLSLGDLNPLIHPPRLNHEPTINALNYVINRNIAESGGISPMRLESVHATSLDQRQQALRYVARFELPIDAISDEQLTELEKVVKKTYGTTVRTRKRSNGTDAELESYPPLNIGEHTKARTDGWYMGPNLSYTDSLHQGLFFFRDYGEVKPEDILKKDAAPQKFIVEIREANLYQTDLVQLITNVSAILGGKECPEETDSLYKIYNDLMRLGLKEATPDNIYGMDEALGKIRRGLLTPLASPDLSQGIQHDPESVLMIGVPGTGKTLIAEQLLHEDTGVFILPLDPIQLGTELQAPKEKQTILPRISQVAQRTGRKAVLHIDDIEMMTHQDNISHSTLLNLMAGIRDSGFYIMASTNHPEKVDPSLLQPQRFGILIYTPLQNEEARREILKIHATKESKRLETPLFSSSQARDIILGEVVQHTESYTPRYLAEIATIAKSHLSERVAQRRGQRVGLTEEDLQGETFTLADWEQALAEVASKYDKQGTIARDREIKAFATKHGKGLGFRSQGATEYGIFSKQAYDKFTALPEEQNRRLPN